MVMEEILATLVRMIKRVKEASQSISDPLEKSVCKSTINKPKKKVVANESEIKTSPKLPAEDKAGDKTSELTEEVNKRVDSPKVIPCKKKEEAHNQQVPSTLIREIVKEEKPKEPEGKRKPIPSTGDVCHRTPYKAKQQTEI